MKIRKTIIDNTSKPKPSTYQSTSKDLKEEHDMPGFSGEEIREAFFKPVR